MAPSDGGENPYNAPQVRVDPSGRRGSALRRFWLGCLGWFLVMPGIALASLLHLPSAWMLIVLTVLGVLWLSTIASVVRAYRGTAMLNRVGVTLGLVIALTVCFLFGAALAVMPISKVPINVTLPQRSI